jgi:hypothetical protein
MLSFMMTLLMTMAKPKKRRKNLGSIWSIRMTMVSSGMPGPSTGPKTLYLGWSNAFEQTKELFYILYPKL